jgi:hypothetical protein
MSEPALLIRSIFDRLSAQLAHHVNEDLQFFFSYSLAHKKLEMKVLDVHTVQARESLSY